MVRRWVRRMAWVGVLLIAWDLRGQTQPPATQDASETRLEEILRRLGDPKFTVREQAQRDLRTLPADVRDTLAWIAEKTSDDEVKARLQQRVAEMDVDRAIDPPPISIDVKDGSFADVAEALSQATGTVVDVWPPGQVTAKKNLFTLHAENVPFWEVMGRLNAQTPVSLKRADCLRLAADGEGMPKYTVVRGMAVLPPFVQRMRAVNPRVPRANVQVMRVAYQAIFDPRAQVLDANFTTLRIVDDVGNVLVDRKAGQMGAARFNVNGIEDEVSFAIQPGMGKKIASMKGSVAVTIPLVGEHVEVNDVQKNCDATIKVGERTVTFTQFQIGRDYVSFSLEETGEHFPVHQNGPFGQPNRMRVEQPVRVTLVDATGKTFWVSSVAGKVSRVIGATCVSPVTARIVLPTATKVVNLDYELKDIPLPAK